jgi:hypothetical protein
MDAFYEVCVELEEFAQIASVIPDTQHGLCHHIQATRFILAYERRLGGCPRLNGPLAIPAEMGYFLLPRWPMAA